MTLTNYFGDKAINIGTLFLSDAALGMLKKYHQKSNKAEQTASWQECLKKDLIAVDDCLKIFPELARKDLKTLT